jgi:hypothetical protein
LYGRRHSLLGKELRGEISLHGVSPAGMLDPTDMAIKSADAASASTAFRDKDRL